MGDIVHVKLAVRALVEASLVHHKLDFDAEALDDMPKELEVLVDGRIDGYRVGAGSSEGLGP